MIIPSHTALAARLHDYMAMNHGFNVTVNAFYRGSIAPDLGDKEKGSHYGDKCLEQATEILREIREDESGDITELSYKLGLLTHFIADYFTNAHNKIYLQRNMRMHMLYEVRLHWALSRVDRKPVYNFNLIKNDPIEQMRIWHQEYLYGRAGIEKDIHYIMMANHFLVERVLAEKGLALGLLMAA